jgi:hypothetical protein
MPDQDLSSPLQAGLTQVPPQQAPAQHLITGGLDSGIGGGAGAAAGGFSGGFGGFLSGLANNI